MQTHQPRRAAVEIERARKAAGLSFRNAAALAAMSESRWRQIAKGSQAIVKDHAAPVNAKPETLARMAIAVGVTSTDLLQVDEPEVAAAVEHLKPPSMTIDEFQARVDQTASAGVVERLARLEADVGAMENRLRILEAREAARGSTPATASAA